MTNTSKFKNIPQDEDTRIFSRKLQKYENLEFCIEHWSWDGIHGRSVIFLTAQVKDKTDQELETLARKLSAATEKHKATITRDDEGYVFCNLVNPEDDID